MTHLFPMPYENHTLTQLARICQADWKNIYFGAKPYLDVMRQMTNIHDKYVAEDGRSVVLYFLNNAKSWRGETAKAVKAELKRRLK